MRQSKRNTQGAVPSTGGGLTHPGAAPRAAGERIYEVALWLLCMATIAAGYLSSGAAVAALGRLLFAVIESEPAALKLRLALEVLGFALVVGAGLVALRRGSPSRGAKVALLALLFAVSAVRYKRGLRPRGTAMLGPLYAIAAPHAVIHDRSLNRPHRRYALNAHGLRGADFTRRPAEGTLRVAVVGDSFVFGLGVGERETLPVQLQELLPRPRGGRRLEVLNLGIPGNNLRSHIRACQHAWDELGASLVVLLYHLPNDFARWGGQDERRDEGRPSLFSLLGYLVGPEIATTLVTRFVVDGGALSEVPDAETQLRVLRELMPALDRAQGARPLIVLPIEFQHLPGATERFARRPHTVVTRRFGFDEPLLIPFDGHPNAAGMRAYAEAVVAAGPSLRQWSTMFEDRAPAGPSAGARP